MSAITYDDLLARNLALIGSVCKRPLSESSRFVEDLDLDSIDLVGLISEMEDEFRIIVPEDRLHSLRTVGEATRCLYDLMQSGGQAA